MLTYFFKSLDYDQKEFLAAEVGSVNTGRLHDLLQDSDGFYALVEESKKADFEDFLEKIGVDLK